MNTGSFDPFDEIADAAAAAGAWLHVDGAFGLWAAASPRFAHLAAGAERADSWATDAHKWLNVPYDCGHRPLRSPGAAPPRDRRSTPTTWSTRGEGGPRDQMDWTPEFSRRARGFTVYAAIRSLGRSGIAELVERCCDLRAAVRGRHRRRAGRRGAQRRRPQPGALPLRLRRADRREARRRAGSGVAWMSGTTWAGRQAIRISVSNWQTTEEDVDRTVAAFAQLTRRVLGHQRDHAVDAALVAQHASPEIVLGLGEELGAGDDSTIHDDSSSSASSWPGPQPA